MKRQRDIYFEKVFDEVYSASRLSLEKNYIQHGDTSTLLHSIAVAYFSYKVAMKLSFLKFRSGDVIRGGLLHDYFLYDWHDGDPSRKTHGFSHPDCALINAGHDFSLNPVEIDIIKKHMFPLTLTPPKYKETLLICIIDKICSTYEVFKRCAYSKGRLRDLARA